MSDDGKNDNLSYTNTDLNLRLDLQKLLKINGSSDHDVFDVNPVQFWQVQLVFYVVYSLIFVIGISGNALVLYVVQRKATMRTVTNNFISSLALADILLCILCVPFTPLYTFIGHWVFGSFLCHLVTCAQGISVYISSVTLTTIALDRLYVMMYPFNTRMSQKMCASLILVTWLFSIAATMPYAYFVEHRSIGNNRFICQEAFPKGVRVAYGSLTTALQFVLPFTIMLVAYTAISLKLTERTQNRPGSRSASQEQEDIRRTRNTNWMLVAMVTVFGTAWLPFNLLNLLDDISEAIMLNFAQWRYFHLLFFIAHAFAMSSTCYNPFLYAWLNEAFRKEFREIIPCFSSSSEPLEKATELRAVNLAARRLTTHSLNHQANQTAHPTEPDVKQNYPNQDTTSDEETDECRNGQRHLLEVNVKHTRAETYVYTGPSNDITRVGGLRTDTV